MAGRSIPGRVFSTWRANAINAPVLPALHAGLRTTVTHLLERYTHRGTWFAAQGLSRPLVHRDHFRRIDDFQARTIDTRMLGDQLFE